MKSLNEFVSLQTLIHSSRNLPRQYFVYRKAVESGKPGARLRFEWFCQKHGAEAITRIESLFGYQPLR